MSLCMRLNVSLEQPFHLRSRVEMNAENVHMHKSPQLPEEGQILLVIADY